MAPYSISFPDLPINAEVAALNRASKKAQTRVRRVLAACEKKAYPKNPDNTEKRRAVLTNPVKLLQVVTSARLAREAQDIHAREIAKLRQLLPKGDVTKLLKIAEEFS